MIFDGKLVREESLKELKKKFKKIKCGLAVIQVGDDFASNKYIAHKAKLANELCVNFKLIKLEFIYFAKVDNTSIDWSPEFSKQS